MANLTPKTIAELSLASAVRDSDLVVISRSGSSLKMSLETLVGNRVKNTGDTITGTVKCRSENLDVSALPSTNQNGNSFALVDTNGNIIGSVYSGRTTSGRNSTVLRVNQTVNGETASNYLLLGIEANGDPVVTFADANAWKKALGLVKLADNEIANTIVPASGITINTLYFRRYGDIAQLYISWKSGSAISVPANGNVTDLDIGTLVSGRRPYVASVGKSSSTLATYSISAAGLIRYTFDTPTGAERTIAAGTNMNLYATYILA